MNKFDLKVSKHMSFILRHNPLKFGVILDGDGFVPISILVHQMNEYNNYTVTESDIVRIVETCPKQRYRLKGDMVGAKYGHSIKERIKKFPVVPPLSLYHGTASENVD